jgi:hypothetical protein
MAYSAFQADRIRRRLRHHKIVEKPMMGGLIFMVNDAMCVGLDRDKNTLSDRLMVRVGKLQYEALLEEKSSRPMDFTGRVMRGFLFVDAVGFDSDEDLGFWVERALDFNVLLTNAQP